MPQERYDFVNDDSTPMYEKEEGSKKSIYLLWGDRVKVLEEGRERVKVKARGQTGWVEKDALGGESLLELYFIDVGQGDGILIKTPSFRHIMIDGGFPRGKQDTGKNAADFVDWKFVEDYGMEHIDLDAMIVSHCDEDHYGGLSDLLDVRQSDELDAKYVHVERFYHAGLSWWVPDDGDGRTLGPYEKVGRESYWTRLLEDRDAVEQASNEGDPHQLAGNWGKFFDKVLSTQTHNGEPTPVERLSHASGYVPEFGPDVVGEPSIKVLGPVEFEGPCLRRFSGGNSQNTNGVSLLLRVDFGNARMILTGDLNKRSQLALLADYEGEEDEFACDVAKACHHGSEDISYTFLSALKPSATIISSGDNEGHDHPRPSIISASALTGYVQLDEDGEGLVTPLVYSTELARSVDLGIPTKLEELDKDGEVTDTLRGAAFRRSLLHLKGTRRKTKKAEYARVVGRLIYGLVNVRTDGKRILCATLDEQKSKWRIKSFAARFQS